MLEKRYFKFEHSLTTMETRIVKIGVEGEQHAVALERIFWIVLDEHGLIGMSLDAQIPHIVDGCPDLNIPSALRVLSLRLVKGTYAGKKYPC